MILLNSLKMQNEKNNSIMKNDLHIKNVVSKILNEADGPKGVVKKIIGLSDDAAKYISKKLPMSSEILTPRYVNYVKLNYGDDIAKLLEKALSNDENILAKGTTIKILTNVPDSEIPLKTIKDALELVHTGKLRPDQIMSKLPTGVTTFKDGTKFSSIFTPNIAKRASMAFLTGIVSKQGPTIFIRRLWELLPLVEKTLTNQEKVILSKWFWLGTPNWAVLNEIIRKNAKQKEFIMLVNLGGQIAGKFLFWVGIMGFIEVLKNGGEKKYKEANKEMVLDYLNEARKNVPFMFVVPFAAVLEFILTKILPGGWAKLSFWENYVSEELKSSGVKLDNKIKKPIPNKPAPEPKKITPKINTTNNKGKSEGPI
jgi:hypothetical protein